MRVKCIRFYIVLYCKCNLRLPCLQCFRYGEIVNVNLVRDKDTGKSKGFAFLCYEDQRSTILAVDNLNGAKVKAS